MQVGTLEELETFHEFLMKDIYREEKSINFAAAFSQGREIDKKYYILPLRLQESMDQDTLVYSIDRDLMRYICRLNKEGY